MNEEIKIIEGLRKLGRSTEMPGEKEFIKNLRIRLADHIAAHSAVGEKNKTIRFSKFALIMNLLKLPVGGKILTFRKAMGTMTIFAILSATGVAVASQNSLPGENLYSIKIMAEGIRASFAFAPETKAIIQMNFAEKRVEEVKKLIEQDDTAEEKITIALDNLEKNVDASSAIIENEINSGNNDEKIINNVNASLNKNKEALDQIFGERTENLKAKEETLKNKIQEAEKIDDHKLINKLNKELDNNKTKRDILEKNRERNKKIFDKKGKEENENALDASNASENVQNKQSDADKNTERYSNDNRSDDDKEQNKKESQEENKNKNEEISKKQSENYDNLNPNDD